MLMGLSPSFIATPPGFDIAHDSLPAIRDVHVLHSDRLLAAIAMLAKGLYLGRECTGKFIIGAFVTIKLGKLIC